MCKDWISKMDLNETCLVIKDSFITNINNKNFQKKKTKRDFCPKFTCE